LRLPAGEPCMNDLAINYIPWPMLMAMRCRGRGYGSAATTYSRRQLIRKLSSAISKSVESRNCLRKLPSISQARSKTLNCDDYTANELCPVTWRINRLAPQRMNAKAIKTCFTISTRWTALCCQPGQIGDSNEEQWNRLCNRMAGAILKWVARESLQPNRTTPDATPN